MRRDVSAVLLVGALTASMRAADRPNILWLTCEDISPNLGCYGDPDALTPNLDRFARAGIRYVHAYGITGVCAVNRSCLITGMYSSSIGSQDMRSRTRLPDSIRCFSEVLREAGYYCTNNSKTDYNFPVPQAAWDESSRSAHWKNRKPGQPFFAVFNYTGSHESQIWATNHARHAARLRPRELHDPAKISVPPFHPDVPAVRRDWANYHDNITALDHWFAARLEEIARANLAENTIVFFYSDHGAGMPGCKKWVWDAGLRVPLIIRFPEKWANLAPSQPGSVSDRLVSFVDFAPTALSLCGVPVPSHMQGTPFLGARTGDPRRYAYIIRDRMAERYDIVRGVRSKRFQYLRNCWRHVPWSQLVSYTERMPTMQIWRRMHAEGELNPSQDRYFQTKPAEELYDTARDPYMLDNLADNPEYAGDLARLGRELHEWQLRTRDLGLLPEYEIRWRAAGRTPYDVGRDQQANPIRALMAAADLANAGEAKNLARLQELLRNGDHPALRWWGAVGLVTLGERSRAAAGSLIEALTDTSPNVRIAAADALCNLGRHEDAMPVLVAGLQHASPCIRLRAINVLDRIGEHARPALPAIRRASMKEGSVVPAVYLNRMVGYVPEKFR